MKKKAPDSAESMLDPLNRLLGQIEDLTSEELAEEIGEGGIDLRSAQEALYARVSELRAKLWEKNLDVKSDVTSLLTQMRPLHLPTSDPKVAKDAAARWVHELIAAPKPTDGTIEFAAAARNLDGSLTDADRDIMRELQEALLKRSGEAD
ncbi:MAG: hypothetical protein AB7I25_02030 [Vicinamibacterales bacterium]